MNARRLSSYISCIGLLLLALAGCGGAEPEQVVVTQLVETTRVVTETIVEEGMVVEVTRLVTAQDGPEAISYNPYPGGGGQDDAPAAAPQAVTRLVIKDGYLELEVASTQTVARQATTAIIDRGGYVISQRVYSDGAGNTFAEMSYGIPVDNFEAAMDALRGLGTVLEDAATGTDVTDEYVDLNSRLENLYATQAQLRIFLEQAEDTEATLDVYGELSAIEAEIGLIQGRINYLSDRAAFSTINLVVNPILPTPTPAPTAPPPTPAVWSPGHTARTAAVKLQDSAQNTADFFIFTGIFWGPWLLLLALAWLVIRRLFPGLHRWRQRTTPIPPPPPVD